MPELINGYLIELDKHTKKALGVNDSDEKTFSAWEADLGRKLDYKALHPEAYLLHLQKLCVRYCSVTRVNHYLDIWEADLTTRIPDCFTDPEQSETVTGHSEVFFQKARGLVKIVAGETVDWLVTQMIHLQLRPYFQKELWMPPVKQNRLRARFFKQMKGYFEVLDDWLAEEEYKVVLKIMMQEVNRALVWVLTDKESKSNGRCFEPDDGQILQEDIKYLNLFFKEWDYVGPSWRHRENPLNEAFSVSKLVSAETRKLKMKAKSLICDKSRSVDPLKLSRTLKVLYFRAKDGDAQAFVADLISKGARPSASFFGFKPAKVRQISELVDNLTGQLNLKSMLTVQVISGKNLDCGKNGVSHAYVVVKVTGQEKRTKVHRKTLNPEWKEKLSFVLPYKFFDSNEILDVHFQCYNRDFLNRDKLIGHASFFIKKNQDSDIATINLMAHENEIYSCRSKGQLSVVFDTSEM